MFFLIRLVSECCFVPTNIEVLAPVCPWRWCVGLGKEKTYLTVASSDLPKTVYSHGERFLKLVFLFALSDTVKVGRFLEGQCYDTE